MLVTQRAYWLTVTLCWAATERDPPALPEPGYFFLKLGEKEKFKVSDKQKDLKLKKWALDLDLVLGLGFYSSHGDTEVGLQSARPRE